MNMIVSIVVVLLISGAACFGEIVRKDVAYAQGGTNFKSLAVYDDASQDKRPGILVVPEWWGLNDYTRRRAEQLAELGYVALAVDVYGDGNTTTDAKKAGEWSGNLKKDRKELRQRVNAALDELKKLPQVDPERLGAIGYCFGGTTVLELARSGADVDGVVSFHGGLDSPRPADAEHIKAQILVCHGGADEFVTQSDYNAFVDELKASKVYWQINTYDKALHSFTNPDADKTGIKGIAYHELADRKSWEDMKRFFVDVFGQ